MPASYATILCAACKWTEQADEERMHAWLGQADMRRAGTHMDIDMLWELLPVALARVACPDCGAKALKTARSESEENLWPEAPICVRCRAPIPAERLEALPDVKICAVCQAKQEEHGTVAATEDFCTRCGAPLKWAIKPGTSRYLLVCSQEANCR